MVGVARESAAAAAAGMLSLQDSILRPAAARRLAGARGIDAYSCSLIHHERGCMDEDQGAGWMKGRPRPNCSGSGSGSGSGSSTVDPGSGGGGTEQPASDGSRFRFT